jgi:hypothetical protein
MITPAPTVTEHDDFEQQLLELRKREKLTAARAT